MHEIRGVSYAALPDNSPKENFCALDRTRPCRSQNTWESVEGLSLLATERTKRRKVPPTRLRTSTSHQVPRSCRDLIRSSIRINFADKAGTLECYLARPGFNWNKKGLVAE